MRGPSSPPCIVGPDREYGNVKRYSLHESLCKAVHEWLLTVRSKNAVANTLMLKKKASFFAKASGITDFVPSDGWVTRWKRRFNISLKKISDQGKSYTPELIAPWKETSLLTLLSKYDLQNIYNSDEFGLFYQIHPEKSLHLEKEKCIGGKQSKIRITRTAASNALGGKIPVFLIGKSLNPCCFKRDKNKSCSC